MKSIELGQRVLAFGDEELHTGRIWSEQTTTLGGAGGRRVCTKVYTVCIDSEQLMPGTNPVRLYREDQIEPELCNVRPMSSQWEYLVDTKVIIRHGKLMGTVGIVKHAFKSDRHKLYGVEVSREVTWQGVHNYALYLPGQLEKL